MDLSRELADDDSFLTWEQMCNHTYPKHDSTIVDLTTSSTDDEIEERSDSYAASADNEESMLDASPIEILEESIDEIIYDSPLPGSCEFLKNKMNPNSAICNLNDTLEAVEYMLAQANADANETEKLEHVSSVTLVPLNESTDEVFLYNHQEIEDEPKDRNPQVKCFRTTGHQVVKNFKEKISAKLEMDLRKQVLLKKPLSEISLNSSNVSIYESASEDSDSESFYYSFTDTSSKNFEDSLISKNISNSFGNNDISSSPEDKDTTVIQVDPKTPQQTIPNIEIVVTDCDSETTVEEKVEDTQNDIDQVQQAEEVNNELETQPTVPLLNISTTDQLDDIEEPDDMAIGMDVSTIQDKVSEDLKENLAATVISPSVEILNDPNKSLVNPFTLGIIESPAVDFETIPVKSAKKSATKIPVKTHLYSPLQRKSIDRSTKIVKPSAARRTIYETRSQTTIKKVEVSKSVPKITTASRVTKPIASKPSTSSAQAAPKRQSSFKCKFAGCNREFLSGIAYREHLKTHNGNARTSSTSSSSSTVAVSETNKCKWCDKKFEIPTALVTHMIDSCTKISFAEKRKLIAEQEKKNVPNTKRKSMFVAPEPVARKRSPTRRQTILDKKSGVITPKKTMKCHHVGCGQLFTDVLAFANHMVSHKYDGVVPQAAKQV